MSFQLQRRLWRATRTYPFGVRFAAFQLLAELNAYLIHRRGVRKARRYADQPDLKLHLGSGNNRKEGWVNVDLSRYADVGLDLRQPLPFRNGSCSYIYTEHFLEHLDYPEPATQLVRECHRVLKAGGILNVVVPDIELVLKSYANGGTEEYYAAQRQWCPDWCKTQIEFVNYNFRQDNEHRFCYDYETLKLLLERCGFTNIRRRDYNPQLDRAERRIGSLYVIAEK